MEGVEIKDRECTHCILKMIVPSHLADHLFCSQIHIFILTFYLYAFLVKYVLTAAQQCLLRCNSGSFSQETFCFVGCFCIGGHRSQLLHIKNIRPIRSHEQGLVGKHRPDGQRQSEDPRNSVQHSQTSSGKITHSMTFKSFAFNLVIFCLLHIVFMVDVFSSANYIWYHPAVSSECIFIPVPALINGPLWPKGSKYHHVFRVSALTVLVPFMCTKYFTNIKHSHSHRNIYLHLRSNWLEFVPQSFQWQSVAPRKTHNSAGEFRLILCTQVTSRMNWFECEGQRSLWIHKTPQLVD